MTCSRAPCEVHLASDTDHGARQWLHGTQGHHTSQDHVVWLHLASNVGGFEAAMAGPTCESHQPADPIHAQLASSRTHWSSHNAQVHEFAPDNDEETVK